MLSLQGRLNVLNFAQFHTVILDTVCPMKTPFPNLLVWNFASAFSGSTANLHHFLCFFPACLLDSFVDSPYCCWLLILGWNYPDNNLFDWLMLRHRAGLCLFHLQAAGWWEWRCSVSVSLLLRLTVLTIPLTSCCREELVGPVLRECLCVSDCAGSRSYKRIRRGCVWWMLHQQLGSKFSTSHSSLTARCWNWSHRWVLPLRFDLLQL